MVSIAKKIAPEPKISSEVQPRELSSPRATIQEPLVPSSKGPLEENVNKEAPPLEPSLDEQLAENVEMQPAETIAEQSGDESERPVPLAALTRAEPWRWRKNHKNCSKVLIPK